MNHTLSQIKFIRQAQRSKHKSVLMLALIALPVIALIAISVGPASVTLTDFLFTQQLTHTEKLIITEIRMPRLLMTIVTGAGLAISGAILQALFRNPLADPGIIGVSSGAALAAAIGFWLNATLFSHEAMHLFTIPFMAFIGALIALFLLVVLAGGKQAQTSLLILSGIAINTAAVTLLGIIILVVDDTTLRQITFWSMGSYAGIGFGVAICATLLISAASYVLWQFRQPLMQIAVNEKQAKIAGVDTHRIKNTSLIAVALIVAVCVCFTGIVGFVGLIVPHICRMLTGSNLKILLPLSAILGAALVSSADILARVLIMPAEMPIGLITSMLGAPFFIYLIYQQQKRYSDV